MLNHISLDVEAVCLVRKMLRQADHRHKVVHRCRRVARGDVIPRIAKQVVVILRQGGTDTGHNEYVGAVTEQVAYNLLRCEKLRGNVSLREARRNERGAAVVHVVEGAAVVILAPILMRVRVGGDADTARAVQLRPEVAVRLIYGINVFPVFILHVLRARRVGGKGGKLVGIDGKGCGCILVF